MLEKMGWNKGLGLGKNKDGMVDCIQIVRRDEGQALGAESEKAESKFKWNDALMKCLTFSLVSRCVSAGSCE